MVKVAQFRPFSSNSSACLRSIRAPRVSEFSSSCWVSSSTVSVFPETCKTTFRLVGQVHSVRTVTLPWREFEPQDNAADTRSTKNFASGAGGGNRTIRAYSFYVTYCKHTNARTAQPAVCPPPMYKIMYNEIGRCGVAHRARCYEGCEKLLRVRFKSPSLGSAR
jgi:hypothetical protein